MRSLIFSRINQSSFSNRALSLISGFAIGAVATIGVSYYWFEEAERSRAVYMAEVTRPDLIVPLGDLNKDDLQDYIVIDSWKDKEGTNSELGRYTIFLGSQNGLSYPLNKSSLSETEQARIKKSAEEMAALKLSLALPRKNN